MHKEPRLARWLLEHVAGSSERAVVLGDLAEAKPPASASAMPITSRCDRPFPFIQTPRAHVLRALFSIFEI